MRSLLENGRSLGADQAILVPNETTKREVAALVPDSLVLTPLEAKGLEFDSVLLWDACQGADCSQAVWLRLYDLLAEGVAKEKRMAEEAGGDPAGREKCEALLAQVEEWRRQTPCSGLG